MDQAKSAVRHFHNLNFSNMPNPTESIRVANVLKGIKRRFLKPVQKKKAISNKEFSKLLAFVLKGNSTTTMKLADLSFALQVSLMFCLFARFEESVVLKN